MTIEKQIIEIKECIDAVYGADCAYFDVDGFEIANEIYNAGYRKATDVAREIFEEIENAHEECIHIDPSTNIGYLLQTKFEHKLAELKNKYTEEGK